MLKFLLHDAPISARLIFLSFKTFRYSVLKIGVVFLIYRGILDQSSFGSSAILDLYFTTPVVGDYEYCGGVGNIVGLQRLHSEVFRFWQTLPSPARSLKVACTCRGG